MPSLSIGDYILPNINSLLTTTSNTSTGSIIPKISGLLKDSENHEKIYTDSSVSSIRDNIMSDSKISLPNLAVLSNGKKSGGLSESEINLNLSNNIPMLSVLNNDNLPQLSIFQQDSSNLIDFNSSSLGKEN